MSAKNIAKLAEYVLHILAGKLPSSGALTLLAAEAAAAWLVSTAVRSRVERSAAADVASRNRSWSY